MRKYFFFIGLGLLLAACNAGSLDSVPGIEDDRMTSRHQAAIPNEYAGLTNPIPPDASSLERGASLYATNCARCHGDSGMGTDRRPRPLILPLHRWRIPAKYWQMTICSGVLARVVQLLVPACLPGKY